MPLFKVDTEKSYGSEFWTNRYIVEAGSIENAQEGGLIIIEQEREFHRTFINFTKLRVSTFTPNDDVFIITPYNADGNLVASSGGVLPLFNVMRVDLAVEGFGRPSRKFYRTGLMAGDVTLDFTVTGDAINTVVPAVEEMISQLQFNSSPLVDVDGQAITSAVSFGLIAMRQLRRGSRRRTEPVL